jgi:hypothetical protein
MSKPLLDPEPKPLPRNLPPDCICKKLSASRSDSTSSVILWTIPPDSCNKAAKLVFGRAEFISILHEAENTAKKTKLEAIQPNIMLFVHTWKSFGCPIARKAFIFNAWKRLITI